MAHSLKLKEFLRLLETVAPLETAESWDNVGLMTGDPEQQVTGVIIALDPTLQVVEEAIATGANTVVTHHPLFFHPVKSIRTDTPFGILLKKALSNDIAIIGLHTNLDVARGGVSDTLAETLSLQDFTSAPPSREENARGFVRIGSLAPPMEGNAFLKHVASRLDIPALPVAGALPEKVSRVAVCGGSGSDLAELAFQAGAQVYISGEIKHSAARWAEENGFCIIDAGHFATENIIVKKLRQMITGFLTEGKYMVSVSESQKQGSPLSYYLNK